MLPVFFRPFGFTFIYLFVRLSTLLIGLIWFYKHILSNFLRKKKKLTGIDGSCHWLSGRVVITFPSSCLIENISSWSACCNSDVSPKTFHYIVHCFDVISSAEN
jgi:hypothetical protein